jgi:hypothetical protein
VQVKDDEYVSVTNFILQMFRSSRRNTLFATVFGLLYLSPRIPIWIVKNLYKCGDFHFAAKFIIKFINIEFLLKVSMRPYHLNAFGEHV